MGGVRGKAAQGFGPSRVPKLREQIVGLQITLRLAQRVMKAQREEIVRLGALLKQHEIERVAGC